jgi:hypothetical protein
MFVVFCLLSFLFFTEQMSFQKRHKLHGRIVHVKRNPEDSKGNLSFDEPFILYLYHLSPVQRLLNRSAFNFITRQTFLKSSWKQIEERDDLIKVELGKSSARFLFVRES